MIVVNALSYRRYLLAAIALVGCAIAPARAQRDAAVPDPDPELERKSFILADGFEVNLFAADPLLAKPIQMNFDPAGRLWIASSEAYPQIKPGQRQNDKIIILEDTKGVGVADKVTVFAEGLLIPTGLAPGDGGVYVVDSTDMVHLSASKGDGKADRRRLVLSGFGTEDTHHMVHTLRWGPDGMLYFNQSIYIHSHIETPYGPRRLGGGGIWQYRPESQRLEVFARGGINPWGHHFDRWGQSFLTDGANGEGITYVVPGAYYPTAVGATRILNGLNPGSPKHCGLEIASGRHLPDSWQGNMLTNDFRGHRVCRFEVTADGSGYSSRQMTELIKSNHPAFRPIDIKMGPDGAIYIADWYNPIIQHGEVDFRDPRRDHTHGRIWRVTAKNRPLVPRPRLVGAETGALLEAMTQPEDWTRLQARLVLKERGRGVLPALTAWAAKWEPSNPAHGKNLLEALWTYQALDVVEPKLLATLLRAGNPNIRAAATRVVSAWHTRLANPLELLAVQVQDEHPQVRLEAVRALGQISHPRALELALGALDRPLDRFLDYGLWLTCRELQPYWMPAFQDGRLTFAGNTRSLLFALKAVGSADVLRPLVELVRANRVPAESEEQVLTLIASLGSSRDLSLLLDRLCIRATSDRLRVSLLRALEQAAREREIRPEGDRTRIVALLSSESEAVRTATVRLAGLWKLEGVRPTLTELAKSRSTSDWLRHAALEGLVGMGGPASLETIETLVRSETAAPTSRRLALIALVSLDMKTAAQLCGSVLALFHDGAGAAEVFDVFLQRKNGAEVLAKSLADLKLPPDVARVGVRCVRSSGRDAPALVQTLTRAGSLTFGPRQLNPQEMQRMVADVTGKGAPARGERIYRRKDMLCQKCHAIAGAGGQVGPDLSSIGASAQVDYLVESLLEPNKAVKENYHALLVTTARGKQFSGIKVRESTTELVLRTAEDQELALPVKEIEERTMGGSLMPDGLTDTLTRAEFVDLVRFLSEIGKVGPYAVGKARLVRRWQILETSPSNWPMSEHSPGLNWGPAYSTVSGELPLGELPRLQIGKETTPTALVCFQLDVTTPGPVGLKLHGIRGVRAWLGENALPAGDVIALNLPAGLQTVTLAVDLSLRKEPLRCELEDRPSSPARVRLVAGK